MAVLETRVDRSSDEFQANRSAMTHSIERLEAVLEESRQGGGPKYVERHRRRGRLLPRERIELLVDRDSAFLELSPLAGWGSEFALGASAVTGIGVVSGVECVLSASDPTVKGGSINPISLSKTLRAQDIARENRLPIINLVESGGADLPHQADIFILGGKSFRNLTQMSKEGIPSIALVFGNSTAGGAYLPGMSDYAVMIKEQAKVFLGGPPLVKMATGEESEDEELGGAVMHSRVSGLSDYLAEDELDCLRIGREIVSHFNWRKHGYGPTESPDEPLHPADDLLGIVSADLRVSFDMVDVLARIVDGSRLEEYKAEYGSSLVCGWASVHGYRVGVLANQQGVLFSEESQKATEFITLANRYDTPLIFFQNVTGYMVGRDYEQRGIIKDGSKMINAVSNSEVPHLTIMAGASYGAGNYGMAGRSYDPRFLFSWPNSRTAVMGPTQLAGVMSIVSRASAEARGLEYSDEADQAMRASIEEQIRRESEPWFMSSRLRDDGVIDPRDTRTVLGIALSAVHSAPVRGADAYGVFRM